MTSTLYSIRSEPLITEERLNEQKPAKSTRWENAPKNTEEDFPRPDLSLSDFQNILPDGAQHRRGIIPLIGNANALPQKLRYWEVENWL